jgi:hypothetical protein
MGLFQLRNANFGKCCSNLTGSDGVGFTLYDVTGSMTGSRVTSSVYQTVENSGIYAAYIEFPDQFRGSIVWDTGTALLGECGTQYATEQYNYEENNPRVDDIYFIEYGRWRIVGDQMIFYKDDNTTEIARFNLFDESGTPSMDAVFERFRV